MASNYDEYMKELEDGRKAELSEAEKTYGDMSKDYEEEYDKQIEGLDDFEKKQTTAQNESYDFTIEQIEQQKEDAEKDYQKEQTAAYRDYEKQIDPYGVHAEQIAANGLDKSGYSESSKVAMYKAYQNRVTAARESYEKATREFENTMTQARLQNDVALAEIAYNTYQQRVTLTLQKLQTKNGLLIELINKKASIDSTYNSLYADALEKKANNGGNTGLRIYDKGQEVKNKYYSGTIAENVGYFGYMGKDDNGVAYQPKGVMFEDGSAHKLKKYNGGTKVKEIYGDDFTDSSGVNIKNQNIWEADGRYFVWNMTKNAYEEVILP